jgi:hypothetical protein
MRDRGRCGTDEITPRHQTLLGGSGDRSFAGLFRLSRIFPHLPLGTADFVTGLERRLGRPIARRAPGRKAVAIPLGEQLNLLQ